MPKPIVATMYQGEAKPESAGLLTLPRELRDKIYGYLLRIDRFDALWGIGLEMSILRVTCQSNPSQRSF